MFGKDNQRYTFDEMIDQLDNKQVDAEFAAFLRTRFVGWIARAPFMPNLDVKVSPRPLTSTISNVNGRSGCTF